MSNTLSIILTIVVFFFLVFLTYLSRKNTCESKLPYIEIFSKDILPKVLILLITYLLVNSYTFNLSKNNQPLVLSDNISAVQNDSKNIKISLPIKQGSLRRGYIVYFNNNDLSPNPIFRNIFGKQNSDEIEISFPFKDIRETNINVANEKVLFKYHDTVQFGIILEDTNKNTHFKYYVFRPRVDYFVEKEHAYQISLTDKKGKVIDSVVRAVDNVLDYDYFEVNADLYNEVTIENVINQKNMKFTPKYKFFKSDKIEGHTHLKGSNPTLELKFFKPEVEDILNNIEYMKEAYKNN